VAGAACALAATVSSPARAAKEVGRAQEVSTFEFRGISYPSFRDGNYATEDSTASLAALARTGANYVAIIPTQFTRTHRDAAIFRSDKSESDANVAIAIRDARAAGLAVLLKPHIDAMDGKPREYFAPSDSAAWFENYRKFLVHYARIAASRGVELFCIGCELDKLVEERYRADWLRIIASVREVYSGPITYAATWNGAKDVGFWDAVDYIGVDAYNPVSNDPDPSIEDMAEGWRTPPADSWVASKSEGLSPLQFYRELARRYGKPMIFTEIGYKSVAGAAAKPGYWQLAGGIDLELQARAYEAFFRVWSRESEWMRGAFLWHWMTKLSLSERSWRDYTPQEKPAVTVITRWYKGQ
jgi:hypothetical protein